MLEDLGGFIEGVLMNLIAVNESRMSAKPGMDESRRVVETVLADCLHSLALENHIRSRLPVCDSIDWKGRLAFPCNVTCYAHSLEVFEPGTDKAD
jgi:hypothetical protein